MYYFYVNYNMKFANNLCPEGFVLFVISFGFLKSDMHGSLFCLVALDAFLYP